MPPSISYAIIQFFILRRHHVWVSEIFRSGISSLIFSRERRAHNPHHFLSHFPPHFLHPLHFAALAVKILSIFRKTAGLSKISMFCLPLKDEGNSYDIVSTLTFLSLKGEVFVVLKLEGEGFSLLLSWFRSVTLFSGSKTWTRRSPLAFHISLNFAETIFDKYFHFPSENILLSPSWRKHRRIWKVFDVSTWLQSFLSDDFCL